MEAETIQAQDLTRAEARLPRWMTAVAVVATVGVLASGHSRMAVGFGLGAVLALLNYRWLHQAVVTVLGTGEPRVPRRVMAKFAVRYPLMFAGVYVFYRTEWLPYSAVLAGLFVPVAGVLIEALVQLREGLRPVKEPAISSRH
jgi:ATP synthase I subunit